MIKKVLLLSSMLTYAVCEEYNELKSFCTKRGITFKMEVMTPQEWETLKNEKELPAGNRYQNVSWGEFSNTMNKIGLYRIVHRGSEYIEEIYVGKTTDAFGKRLSAHMDSGYIQKNTTIYLYNVSDMHGNATLWKECMENKNALIPYEKALIQKFCPTYNTQHGCYN